MSQTLFDKIWEAHVVSQTPGHPAVLYIDLHLIHEVTSPQAFASLKDRGLKVRRPDRTLGTMDHSTPTDAGLVAGLIDNWKGKKSLQVIDAQAQKQLEALIDNCETHGIELHPLGDAHNGIVHVVGPELGRTQPGMTIVCGDSHTSTHGAFGALAFGIGTTEVEAVLATQCLLQSKPKSVEVRFEGELPAGSSAKDMVLALIAQIGTAGGTGCVFEYTGPAVEALDMDGRMTLCNMSIEAGARAGMVAPDATTFAYLANTPGAPKDFDAAVERWKKLRTDAGAKYERTIVVDATKIAPMVTYGTHPGAGIPIDGRIPELGATPDERLASSLEYMGLEGGTPIAGKKIDVVFIGSCTNSRLADLRSAASVMRGRKVASGVRALIVPGSAAIKAAAEAEGLDVVFKDAGAEWREPGCSMCLSMNDDRVAPGQYAVSTSNRNFEGRQGPGSRTFLASPATAAASAVMGCVTDPRTLEVSA